MKRESKAAAGLWAYVVANVGWRKGYRALLFVACWWVAEVEIGRDLEDCDEYSAHWGLSRAQGYRNQADFRAALPGFKTPRELAAALGFEVVQGVSVDDVMLRLAGASL